MRHSFERILPGVPEWVLAATAFLSTSPLAAQQTPPPGPAASTSALNSSASVAASVEALLDRGAAMAADGNPNATGVLKGAATASLQLVETQGGHNLLSAPPEAMPPSGPLRDATLLAARAHLALGQAAERFAERDLAVQSLARAYRLAGPNRAGTNRLSREVTLALNTALREGLPTVATDDTLDTLASMALWKPRRFSFDLPPGALGPAGTSGTLDGRVELLVTHGKLFPSEAMAEGEGRRNKTVVAPLYRFVASDALPNVLRLGLMTVGYEKVREGDARGLWAMRARVLYPHPLFTRYNRDDRPRAEALCAQFLRVRALKAAALGVANVYSPGGVTSLWMNEVSALWPDDDDDPETADARGARMPKVNTSSPVPRANEIAETPLSMPWLAAGQMIGAPGDIFFFKTTQARPEWEWLREIAHEYGHVALAPTAGFSPPLEPFSNGDLGESLAMMWTASAPAAFDLGAFAPPAPAPPAPAAARGGGSGATGAAGTVGVARTAGSLAAAAPRVPSFDNSTAAMRAAALNHVARYAVPALRVWSTAGPNSPLRRAGTPDGQKYLNGFAIWAERVYGAPLLGAAMQPSLRRSSRSWNNNRRVAPVNGSTLISDWENAASLALKGNARGASARSRAPRLPLWLPGAIETLPRQVPAAQLAGRSPLSLRTGERVATRLFVPAGTRVLHLELRGGGAKAATQSLIAEGWRARPVAPEGEGNAGALEVELGGRSGWQRMVWAARAPVTISGAWFEG
jgi:hypothetical protein